MANANTRLTLLDLLRRIALVPTRGWYRLRAVYRHLRVRGDVTRLLGPQYLRSRERIELDITYACNLRCLNCNRSVSQAPDKMHMSRAMIQDFVAESIGRGKRWTTIRILGGEPTMHPDFLGILEDLLQYKRWHPHCQLQLVTNGNGRGVQAALKKIPAGIEVENSAKTGNLQPSFGPFNLAPADDPAYRNADYRNGCAVMTECGMALTPLGYYPCAVAAGIDRIEGNRLGRAHLPDDSDDMLAAAERLCRLCGHFREGHFIPEQVRAPTLEQKLSPTWAALYRSWREDRKSRKTEAPSRQTEYQLRFQRMPSLSRTETES